MTYLKCISGNLELALEYEVQKQFSSFATYI